MPNRIVKESICTSDNIDQLTPFEENVFIRLLVNCDDYGRMDAREKILASRLFPLKTLKPGQIVDAMNALVRAELVTVYEVGGKPYVQMNTWEKHQQIRAHKSKYPPIDEGNGYQLISDASKCPRNPIQSNTESNPNPNTNTTSAKADMNARFETFWKAYPKHVNKKGAEKAFVKLNPDDGLLETMLAAVERQKQTAQWREQNGQFIPHPTTWLNGRRWEDELPAGKTGIKAVSAQDYEQREYEDEHETPEQMLKRLNSEMGTAM